MQINRMRKWLQAALIGASLCLSPAITALAQNAPSPGPTSPPAANPQGKPGATIVVNPTMQECERGWNSSMKWTKDQFDGFCTKLGASK